MKFYSMLVSLMICLSGLAQKATPVYSYGAVVRGDTGNKNLSLVFTADEFGEGLPKIIRTLTEQDVKASFFFTGRFYRNPEFRKNILKLHANGHYLGPHSDKHLLYCDWTKRDSLLVSKQEFETDIRKNVQSMQKLNLSVSTPHFFIPPFEWWNDSIATWSNNLNLSLLNFTPGIRTAVDYTWPELSSYKSSDWIINHLKQIMSTRATALNGAIILIHAGTDPRRTDKFYNRLDEMIRLFKRNGYSFKRIDSLLATE